MATRRVNPRLLAAFEREQQPPIEPNPDLMAAFESVGVAPEASPVVETQKAPRSRFDVVREYLESTRQQTTQPTTPEADVAAAREADARRDFGAGMLAAGQAFTGNRRAVAQLPTTNTSEAQALAANEARRRELEAWAANRERQRMGEAGLLGQALSADEMAAQREASQGLQRERLGFEKSKEETRAEDKDLDREAKASARAAAAAAARKKAEDKEAATARRNAEGLPFGYRIKAGGSPSKIQREDAAKAVDQRNAVLPIIAKLEALTAQGPKRLADPATRAEVAQAAEQIAAAVRVIENLGVPSGPDVQIQLRLIGDPNNPINEVSGVLPRLLSNLRDYFNNKTETRLQTFGIERDTQAEPSAGSGVKPPEGKVAVEDPANPGVMLMLSPAAAARLKGKKP